MYSIDYVISLYVAVAASTLLYGIANCFSFAPNANKMNNIERHDRDLMTAPTTCKAPAKVVEPKTTAHH